jgi:hypothetical protein
LRRRRNIFCQRTKGRTALRHCIPNTRRPNDRLIGGALIVMSSQPGMT